MNTADWAIACFCAWAIGGVNGALALYWAINREIRKRECDARPASMLQSVTFNDDGGEARCARMIPVNEDDDVW